MSTLITCPSCDRKLRVPEELHGQDVKCPSCGNTFVAPGDEDGTAAPPPSPPRAETTRPAPAYDDRPPRRREELEVDDDYAARRAVERPGKVQAIAIMTLIGGILAPLFGAVLIPSTVCLWPGAYYSLVMGILAIVKGSKLLGQNAHLEPPPKAISVMMIINVVNLDLANLVMGILNLVFLNDPEVHRFFRRQ